MQIRDRKGRAAEGEGLRGGQSQGFLSREIMAWGPLWGDRGAASRGRVHSGPARGQAVRKEAGAGAWWSGIWLVGHGRGLLGWTCQGARGDATSVLEELHGGQLLFLRGTTLLGHWGRWEQEFLSRFPGNFQEEERAGLQMEVRVAGCGRERPGQGTEGMRGQAQRERARDFPKVVTDPFWSSCTVFSFY